MIRTHEDKAALVGFGLLLVGIGLFIAAFFFTTSWLILPGAAALYGFAFMLANPKEKTGLLWFLAAMLPVFLCAIFFGVKGLTVFMAVVLALAVILFMFRHPVLSLLVICFGLSGLGDD